ncbi:MAG TPA: hypothetical protein VKG92_08335, partial [Flavobacteriales bacterium]|nr:hypothetical protein [Flavobacteriales bacterium]
TVFCAVDPNDKLVTPQGYGPQGAVDINTEWFTYTIRFQNTGTDTAFVVEVIDTLDTDLDPASMEILGASHPLSRIMIDPSRVASFLFDDILLPDSGANEVASHGYVQFRMRPMAGSPHLTEITNSAAIVFDVNPPVITNTVVNTLVDCQLWQPAITAIDTDILEATPGDAYQWYYNGAPLVGDTLPMLFITSIGDYSVLVTSDLGCTAMSEPYTVLTTAIHTLSDLRMTVVPNPLRSNARLLLSAPVTGSMELIDVQGRSLWNEPLTGAREVTIERKGLPTGLYQLRVWGDERVLGLLRIVID